MSDSWVERACRGAAMCSGALGLSTTFATAQTLDAESGSLETIVVTAQKRPERLQDVPITINAFDANELDRAGITSVMDLGTVVPGLVYNDVVGYGLPYLRGIGTTATGPGFENPVATYVDGVYYASQGGAALSFNNIASVEVDKGPQGTLFGRNTTGGAIQINTSAPSHDFGGNAELGYGNYNTISSRLYVTGGLTSDIAANLAVVYSDQRKGYGVNLANNSDVDNSSNLGLRSKLLFSFSDATSGTLILDYSRTTLVPALAPAPGTIPQFDPPIPSNPRDVYGYPQPWTRSVQWGVSFNLTHELSFGTLTSITAYRTTFFDSQFDSTLTAMPGTIFFINGNEPHRQASQEWQVASKTGGTFDWVAGAYLYWERSAFLDPTLIGGDSFASFGIPSGIIQAADDKTYSGALYGQGTYRFTPDTSLTTGLRFTQEYKNDVFYQDLPDFDAVTVAPNDRAYANLSWRLALEHKFAPDSMGYVSYNRGFKSGGHANGTPYQPEKLDAFEVGLKQEVLDHRLRVNTALFYYKYDNIQTVTYPNGSLDITNGARAHLYGLDLDAEAAVTNDFRVSAGVELLQSKYTEFPDAPFSTPVPVIPAGQPGYGGPGSGGTVYLTQTPNGAEGFQLPKAPKLSATVAADYSHAVAGGKFASNVTYSYDRGWFAESDNRLRQPGYGVLNAFVSVGTVDDGLVVKLWGKNLTDKLYAAFLASQTNGDIVEWAPPRTYGVTVSKKF